MSESPVRAGVRFAFRTHIRGLVPWRALARLWSLAVQRNGERPVVGGVVDMLECRTISSTVRRGLAAQLTAFRSHLVTPHPTAWRPALCTLGRPGTAGDRELEESEIHKVP